jgi:hypothetical protein
MQTMVDHSSQGARMIHGVFRRAPNTHDAEITTATFFIVVWTVELAPCMTPTYFKPPTMALGVLQNFLNFFFGMFSARHQTKGL